MIETRAVADWLPPDLFLLNRHEVDGAEAGAGDEGVDDAALVGDDVVVGGLFGGGGVADAEGVDDALVFLEGGVDAFPDDADLFQVEDAVELFHDADRGFGEAVVAGSAGDGGVEFFVRLAEGGQVFAAGDVGAGLVEAFELGDEAVFGAGGGEAGGGRFDDEAEAEEVLDVFEGDGGDGVAAAGDGVDETVVAEAGEGGADGGAAEGEAAGELDLGDVLAGGEVAAEDRATDRFVGDVRL